MEIFKRIITCVPTGPLTVYAQDDYIIRVCFINTKITDNALSDKKSRILDIAQKQLFEYFTGKRQVFELKYKLNVSKFDQNVYDRLKEVPYGDKISYAKLAEKCGNVNAARAVGNALQRNPLPIIIPCHRVIGSNGNDGGYIGGSDIKKILLELEKKYARVI